MSFKSYFNEAVKQPRPPRKPKLDGYFVPTGAGTKFKAGDIVLVNIPSTYEDEQDLVKYFRTYHPALAVPYIAKAGTVKLYKRGSVGFGAKYGVEFEDGNIIPIHSSFLVGPFASIDAAKKYQGKHGYKVDIEPNDLAGFEPDSQVEVDEARETSFKKHFVGGDVGFVWFETPIVVKYKTFDCYVLAYKRSTISSEQLNHTTALNFLSKDSDMDRLNNPSYPQYSNCFVFCKVVNKLTKKLQKTQVISSKNSVPGVYFVQAPMISRYTWSEAFNGPYVKNYARLFEINMMPFSGTPKQIATFKSDFELFETGEDKLKTGYDQFRYLHRLKEDQTIINESVTIHEGQFGPYFKEIKKYTINGDCTIYLEESTRNISYVPQKVTNLIIAGRSLNSLEGMSSCDVQESISISSNVKNLKGFPQTINEPGKTLEVRGELQTLEGIPDLVLCDLTFRSLDSFIGARNCVCKGHVEVQGFPIQRDQPKDLTGFFKEANNFSSWSIKDKDIENYTKYRDLEDKHPELEGIFS